MEDASVNHLAVIVAAMANLLIGALWYSPALFYKAWAAENNLSEEDLKAQNPAKVYGITFILSLLMAYNLAFFLAGEETDWAWGLTAGFLTGFGWAAAIFSIIALFEQKTWRYILINSGFIIVYFSVAGLVIGVWR